MKEEKKESREKVKSETEKVNKLLKNIPIKNITELNNLVYVEVNRVREKKKSCW